jgi:hypothetical protein
MWRSVWTSRGVSLRRLWNGLLLRVFLSSYGTKKSYLFLRRPSVFHLCIGDDGSWYHLLEIGE